MIELFLQQWLISIFNIFNAAQKTYKKVGIHAVKHTFLPNCRLQ